MQKTAAGFAKRIFAFLSARKKPGAKRLPSGLAGQSIIIILNDGPEMIFGENGKGVCPFIRGGIGWDTEPVMSGFPQAGRQFGYKAPFGKRLPTLIKFTVCHAGPFQPEGIVEFQNAVTEKAFYGISCLPAGFKPAVPHFIKHRPVDWGSDFNRRLSRRKWFDGIILPGRNRAFAL